MKRELIAIIVTAALLIGADDVKIYVYEAV